MKVTDNNETFSKTTQRIMLFSTAIYCHGLSSLKHKHIMSCPTGGVYRIEVPIVGRPKRGAFWHDKSLTKTPTQRIKDVLYVSWVLGAFSLSQNKSMSSTVAKRTRRWRNLFWLETNCSSLPIERREPREVRGRAMAGWTRGGLEFLQDRCGRVLSWRNCTSSNSNCFFRNSCMLRCVTSGRRCWTRTEARRMLVLCEASDPSVHVTLKPPAHNSCIIQCWWVSAIRLCDNIPKPPILRSSSVSSVSVPQAGTPLCAGLLQVLSHRMVGQWNQRNITSHGTFCNRHMGRFAIDT